jgi:hypothetical protein
VETVVLETLGNVNGLDARSLAERADVQNELVSAASVVIGVKDLIAGLQP